MLQLHRKGFPRAPSTALYDVPAHRKRIGIWNQNSKRCLRPNLAVEKLAGTKHRPPLSNAREWSKQERNTNVIPQRVICCYLIYGQHIWLWWRRWLDCLWHDSNATESRARNSALSALWQLRRLRFAEAAALARCNLTLPEMIKLFSLAGLLLSTCGWTPALVTENLSEESSDANTDDRNN